MNRFHGLLLLFTRGKRFALDHSVFFFLEDLFLDVLVGGQRHVALPDLLAHHLPLLPHLVHYLVVLPRAVTGQTGKIGGEIEARALLAPEGVADTMFLASMFAPEWNDDNLQGASRRQHRNPFSSPDSTSRTPRDARVRRKNVCRDISGMQCYFSSRRTAGCAL